MHNKNPMGKTEALVSKSWRACGAVADGDVAPIRPLPVIGAQEEEGRSFPGFGVNFRGTLPLHRHETSAIAELHSRYAERKSRQDIYKENR